MNWYQSLKRQMTPRAPGTLPGTRSAGRPVAAAGAIGALARVRGDAKARYVVMPRGFRARSEVSRELLTMMPQAGPHRLRDHGASIAMKVIGAAHEDGTKLVEMDRETAKKLEASGPSLLVVPEVWYQPAVALVQVRQPPEAAGRSGGIRPSGKKSAKKMGGSLGSRPRRMTIVVRGTDGNLVPEAAVVVFSNFDLGAGIEGMTDARGEFTFSLAGFPRIDRLFIIPRVGYWSAMKARVTPRDRVEVRVAAIDFATDDSVRHRYSPIRSSDGAGVRVGVVDTGVDLAHPDLRVAGGACTIAGEDPASFGAEGGDHGSHVAGIIAAQGRAPTGVSGVAPAAEIFSYRVFNSGEGASNFSIVRAIDQAVADGCDLINMSLGGGPRDPATEAAIDDAREAGVVCIVAAGNDGRQAVSQPGAYRFCVAVSACGRKKTFPSGTMDALDVARPYGKDKNDFLAAFSNIGPEIDVTGPGVGVISTVPGGYAPMNGTSMACPAVAGVAARLLSRSANASILSATRDASRADRIVRMLMGSCVPLGLGYDGEGNGLPR